MNTEMTGRTAVITGGARGFGNGYRLNGFKLFCTQGAARTYLVNCRTTRDGKQDIGFAIVEKSDSGFEVHPYEDKLGWRGANTGPMVLSVERQLVSTWRNQGRGGRSSGRE